MFLKTADIAQTSLLNVPKKLPITGPRGEWNNTFCPREYRLASKDTSRLTNAEIYGGIDGNSNYYAKNIIELNLYFIRFVDVETSEDVGFEQFLETFCHFGAVLLGKRYLRGPDLPCL